MYYAQIPLRASIIILVHNHAVSDDLSQLAVMVIIAVLLIGPHFIRLLKLLAVPAFRLFLFIVERVMMLIADKVVETALISLLLRLAGIPALEYAARQALTFLIH